MCLIIQSPSLEARPNTDLLRAAYENNEDGLGVMYPCEDGSIHVEKTLPKDWEEAVAWLQPFLELDTALGIHFRLTTHGATNLDMCHPFKVLSMEDGDACDLWMQHNGIMSNMPEWEKGKSDTWHFVQHFVRPIVKDNPEMILDKQFQKWLGGVTKGNRLLFLYGPTGDYVVIDDGSGTKHQDMWLSNTYSLTRTFSDFEYDLKTGKGREVPAYGKWYQDYKKKGSSYPAYYDNWYDDDEWWANDPNNPDNKSKDIVPWSEGGKSQNGRRDDTDYLAGADALDNIYSNGAVINYEDLMELTSEDIYTLVTCNPIGIAEFFIYNYGLDMAVEGSAE